MAKKKAAKKVARKKPAKKAAKKRAKKPTKEDALAARQQFLPEVFETDEELDELVAAYEQWKAKSKAAAEKFQAAYESLKAAMRERDMNEYHSLSQHRGVYLEPRDDQLKVKKESRPDGQ